MLNLYNSGHSSVYGWASVLDRVKHVSVQEIVCQCNTEPLSTKTSIYISTCIYKSIHTLLFHYVTLWTRIPFMRITSLFSTSLACHLTSSSILCSIKEVHLARTEQCLENHSFPAFEKDTTEALPTVLWSQIHTYSIQQKTLKVQMNVGIISKGFAVTKGLC